MFLSLALYFVVASLARIGSVVAGIDLFIDVFFSLVDEIKVYLKHKLSCFDMVLLSRYTHVITL